MSSWGGDHPDGPEPRGAVMLAAAARCLYEAWHVVDGSDAAGPGVRRALAGILLLGVLAGLVIAGGVLVLVLAALHV